MVSERRKILEECLRQDQDRLEYFRLLKRVLATAGPCCDGGSAHGPMCECVKVAIYEKLSVPVEEGKPNENA